MDVLSFIPKGIVKNTADRNAEVGQCLDIHNLKYENGCWVLAEGFDFAKLGKDKVTIGGNYIQVLHDPSRNVFLALSETFLEEISGDGKESRTIYKEPKFGGQSFNSMAIVNKFIVICGSEKDVYIYQDTTTDRDKTIYLPINFAFPQFSVSVIEQNLGLIHSSEELESTLAEWRKKGYMEGYVLMQLYLRLNDNSYIACSDIHLINCGKPRIGNQELGGDSIFWSVGKIHYGIDYYKKSNKDAVANLKLLKKSGIVRDIVIGLSADVSRFKPRTVDSAKGEHPTPEDKIEEKIFGTNQFYFAKSIDINELSDTATSNGWSGIIEAKDFDGEEGSREVINIGNYLNITTTCKRIISYNNRAHFLQFENIYNPIEKKFDCVGVYGFGSSPKSAFAEGKKKHEQRNFDLYLRYLFEAKVFKIGIAPLTDTPCMYLTNSTNENGAPQYVGNTAIDASIKNLTSINMNGKEEPVIVRYEYKDGRFFEFKDTVRISSITSGTGISSQEDASTIAMHIVVDFNELELVGGYVLIPKLDDYNNITLDQFTEWISPLIDKYYNNGKYYQTHMYDVFSKKKTVQIFSLPQVPSFPTEDLDRVVIYKGSDRRPVGVINSEDIKVWKNMNQVTYLYGYGEENKYEEQEGTPLYVRGFLIRFPTFVWAYLPAETGTSQGTILEDKKRLSSNRMQVSEYANPLKISPEHSYRFGDSLNQLITASVVAGQITETKFGQYPLYVFTTNGIYTIEQGDGTVLYSRINEMCGLVANNPDCVIEIDGGILFTTTEGIYVINGRNYQSISKSLESSVSGYDRWPKIAEIIKSHGDVYPAVKLFDLLKSNCAAMYDWFNKEVILFQKGSVHAFVYNFANEIWTTIDSGEGVSFNGAVGGKRIFGYKFMGGDGSLFRNVQFITHIEQRPKSPRKVLLVSRPMRYGEISRIERVITRMNAKKKEGAKDISFRVLGSGNGADYDVLNGFDSPEINNTWIHRMPCSCRYYIFVIAGEVDHFELTEIQAEIRPKYDNRLR